jgi:hypothetical protein
MPVPKLGGTEPSGSCDLHRFGQRFRVEAKANAEISYHSAAVIQENVSGFKISMNYTLTVNMSHSVAKARK